MFNVQIKLKRQSGRESICYCHSLTESRNEKGEKKKQKQTERETETATEIYQLLIKVFTFVSSSVLCVGEFLSSNHLSLSLSLSLTICYESYRRNLMEFEQLNSSSNTAGQTAILQ